MWTRRLLTLIACLHLCLQVSVEELVVGVEEDWGEGLKVVKTYQPASCEFKAEKNDIVHYHYVGRLDNGTEFGKSFDYDTPYIVALGQRRIIAGMDRGLVDMCLWERRRITIPPHLGYGATGVGKLIPPHATLVFYVRLIKLERDGVSLEGDVSLDELWYRAMRGYGNSEWQVTVDNLEEGIRVFTAYEDTALLCLKQCHKKEGPPKLSEQEMKTVEQYAGADNSLILQFLTYAARARCVRECKAKSLSLNRRYPDPVILLGFRTRLPYSYLHYAYYQLGNYEEGAKCFFTFAFHNPDSELVSVNSDFYRKELELGPNEFIWREPPTQPHQDPFLEGVKKYESENYLEAVDLIETTLPLYREALERCQLLCEDVLVMNITESEMGDGMREILDHYIYSLKPDVLDYHSVLGVAIRELLECRVRCHDDVARVGGQVLVDYLPNHFHYLQFSYYQLGQLLKAAECAATYLGMAPSDEVMLHNVRYYTSQYKLQPEDFVPREEYVAITEKLATEKRLLHFATHGEPMKKQGQHGDQEHRQQAHHSEL